MRKFLKRIVLLLAVAGCALIFGKMDIQPTDTAMTGEALVRSLLQKKAETAAEQLAIVPEKEEVELPSRYDYREEGRSVPVRDQGQHGTCWAFAALTALETSMMPQQQYDFSRDHLNHHNAFQMGEEEGGSYIMSVAYLTAWEGPVTEEEDPYGDGVSPDGLSAVCHVQEVRMPEEKDYQAIKQTVYLYGGVESSLYMDFEDPSEESESYSPDHASYAYTGSRESNHDVVIIGWDDAYPAEYFAKPVEGDGAFICQNSWGEAFGEKGIFYVSYYDANIGRYNVAYTGVEDSDNYDRLYQSDLCGWCGQIGYDGETAHFANVYEADSDQNLMAVGFYATGPDTEYRIAVIPEYQSAYDLGNASYVESGYLQYTGYYTVKLPEPTAVEAGDRFAVAVWIDTPGSSYPIAVEYASEELSEAVVLDDGEGYISADGGLYWERVEEEQKSNLCLKVYAEER